MPLRLNRRGSRTTKNKSARTQQRYAAATQQRYAADSLHCGRLWRQRKWHTSFPPADESRRLLVAKNKKKNRKKEKKQNKNPQPYSCQVRWMNTHPACHTPGQHESTSFHFLTFSEWLTSPESWDRQQTSVWVRPELYLLCTEQKRCPGLCHSVSVLLLLLVFSQCRPAGHVSLWALPFTSVILFHFTAIPTVHSFLFYYLLQE